MPTMGHFRRAPVKKLRGPSAYPGRGSPFFTDSLNLRPIGLCPAHRRCRTQGLATLSAVPNPRSLKAFFSFQRSWAFPFRAFLPPGDRNGVSSASSAPALSYETRVEPRTGASAVSSRPVSRTPVRSLGCYARSGPRALLGFFGLSGASSAGPARKRLPFELPLSSFDPPGLAAGSHRDLRGSSPDGLAPPSLTRRARACLTFSTARHPPPF